jgi:lysophospholipase L1-like esterase
VTKELSWPGTGVAFTFTGTTASIGLTVTGTNSADLIIDGGDPIVISSVTGTITTPSGLAKGTHTVVLRKRSEALFGSIYVGNITADGPVVATTASSRQIEIIGDSITVGYGLDGVLPCTNTAALEDNPLTYEALASNSLKAEYNVIAWSGKGLIRNYPSGTVDTSPIMPQLWTSYGANDAANTYTFPPSWNPQAVVINLGTNDWAYQGYRDPMNTTVFASTMVQFVQTVQKHYTAAEIFLMTSPMLSDTYPTAADAQKTNQTNAIKSAIAQLGPKAHLVEWPTQGSDVGCDYHPNAATHAAEAPVLASAISSVLGW